MKKKNTITLMFFCVLIVFALVFAVLKKPAAKDEGKKTESSSSQSVKSESKPASPDSSSLSQAPVSSESKPAESSVTSASSAPASSESVMSSESADSGENINISMEDALFIGDSRTVGLMEYAGITGADFFCNVGMSVYNIDKKPVSVPGIGKVTFTELIGSKKYGKVYIMLGVNEVGYETETTVAKYSDLINRIRENQPNAAVFIEANLHVSKSRSDSDKTVNNAAIDRLNAELEKLADGKTVFYLDANKAFDDGEGNLASDKTSDGTHLYAKHYAEWGRWIMSQTAQLIGEG